MKHFYESKGEDMFRIREFKWSKLQDPNSWDHGVWVFECFIVDGKKKEPFYAECYRGL